MIRKLAALLLVLSGFAVCEYFVFQRSMDPAYARIIVPDLLPPALGEFRVVDQWRKEATSLHPLEVGASYRDSAGVEATLDFMLGARMPHNGIACWLVRGYPLLGEHLRRIKIGNRDAVFDTAFFREGDGITLVAHTECYAEGCVEGPIPEPRRLRLPFFANPHVWMCQFRSSCASAALCQKRTLKLWRRA